MNTAASIRCLLAVFILTALPSTTKFAASQSPSSTTESSTETGDEKTATAPVSPAERQVSILRKAIADASENAERIKRLRGEIDSAVARTKEAREKLSEPDAIEVSATAQGVEELTTMLTDLRGRLKNLEDESAALLRRPTEVQKRLLEIPGEISAAESKLAELSKRVTSQPDESLLNAPATDKLTQQELLTLDAADATEDEWTSAAVEAQIRELRLRIEALQTERESYKTTAGITPLQKAVVDRRLQQMRAQIARTTSEIEQKKRVQAERQNNRLQDAVAVVPKPLRELAQSNVDLASLQQRLVDQAASTRSSIDRIRQTREQVDADLTTAEKRIDSVGLTDALGLLLRRKREQNQSLRFKFRPSEDLRDTISQYQIETFQLQDEANELSETGIDPTASTDPAVEIDWSTMDDRQTYELLIGRRRALIIETLQTLETLTTETLLADTERQELLKSIDQYTDFVDGHLFWIRSAPSAGRADLSGLDETLVWLLDAKNWLAVVSHVLSTAIIMPLRCIALVLVVLAMFFFRPRMRRELSSAPEQGRGRIPLRHTLATVGWTMLSAGVWPVCIGAMAIVVLSLPSGDPMVRGVGWGLALTALYVASRNLLSESCRDNGLGDAHFGWSKSVRKLLQRNLLWYTSLGGASLFLIALYHEHPNVALRTIGTRWMSIILFLLTALFNHLLLRPNSSVYSQISLRNPDSPWVYYRKTLWIASFMIPILFAALSLGGYLETSFQLGRSLQLTFLLLVTLIIVSGLVDRAFRLRRREENRREHLRQLELSSDSSTTSLPTSDAAPEIPAAVADISIEDDSVTLETLDRQSRQLASLLVGGLAMLGLSVIWKEVFPAVAFLDGLTLYDVKLGGEVIETVTWLDAMITVLIGGVLYYAIRNLPSLTEFVILRRTSLDAGAKYAVTTLMRYVLLIVGLIWLLDRLRVPYEQLGWLLAAASVGLGFGLQEIVANFVSGIILLIERPVRVGDIVTIDGQTGLVSKIQMRSTTVTNWDRKELVIPNKDLITEKLLNWSLSNVVNRLVLNVGVAYGSDPEKVRRILRESVLSHPDVLKDPDPMINLDTFGDSSLNFVIRCFLPNLDNRLEVTHQINSMIAKRLAAENIEIPFPQMDVHLSRD